MRLIRPAPFRLHRRLPLGRGVAGGLALVGVLPLLGLSWHSAFLTPGDVIMRLALAVGALAGALVLWNRGRNGPPALPMGAPLQEAERRLLDLAAGEGTARGWDRFAPLFGVLALGVFLLGAVWAQYNAL